MAWLPSADPLPRIEFYVKRGLVPRMPTPEELASAERDNTQTGAGVIQRLRWYARHPLDVFPTRRKRRRLRQSNAEAARSGLARSAPSVEELRAEERARDLPWLDRALRALFLWSPARFAVQCLYNPYYPLPGSGLEIPTRYLIEHVLHSPHPSALWDLQIIAADPGGLDALERRLEECGRSRSLRSRIYRALAQREGYYDYLRELCAQVRRFDYPPTRPHCRPEFENLVLWLNYAMRERSGEEAAR
jgi:hypothetical protein